MCEYSPFGVKIVKLSANIVLHGVNTVNTIASLFLIQLYGVSSVRVWFCTV